MKHPGCLLKLALTFSSILHFSFSIISSLFLLYILPSLIKKFSYIIEGRVCYLTMCDRAYPKKLAFQYLEDLKNEFERSYANQIETAARPYAFIKFGTFL